MKNKRLNTEALKIWKVLLLDYKDQIVPLNQKEFSLYFYIKDHSSNLPSINNDYIV
jgi:hypothetical protein